MKFVVDTHVLIWFLEGSSQLSREAKAILTSEKNEFILPAIVLAEAVWIVRRGKTNIPSIAFLLRALRRDPQMSVFSLNQEVVEKSVELTAIREMHDRQIVATALIIQAQGEEVVLLTCDRNITESNLVPIIW